MDHLLLPPNPSAVSMLALPAPQPASPNGLRASTENRSKVLSVSVVVGTVIANLLLLPLRLLRRLAVDLAAALSHLWMAVRDGLVAALVLAFLTTAVVAEAFGENFFLGEVFRALFPEMQAFVTDTPLGALLVSVFPFLDDLRASMAFAFVVAGASVLGLTLFFGGLREVMDARVKTSPVVQEALMLDPNAQEQPAVVAHVHVTPGAWVEIVVGALAGLLILTFEIYAFHTIVDYGWLGPLAALLLFGARLTVGYLAHLLHGSLVRHAKGLLLHAESFVLTLLSVVRNLLEELLDRLHNLATR